MFYIRINNNPNPCQEEPEEYKYVPSPHVKNFLKMVMKVASMEGLTMWRTKLYEGYSKDGYPNDYITVGLDFNDIITPVTLKFSIPEEGDLEFINDALKAKFPNIKGKTYRTSF